jgi:hopanoid C-2 methylase
MSRGRAKNRRRILCIFARYSRTFGTFHHAYQFFPDAVAFMPPQGMLTVAAYLPDEWEVRFVDENVRLATDDEYRWCDAVLASGMHVQRPHLDAIAARAHSFGKVAVLGGPSVSACPDYHPTYDILHLGELGDATDELIAHLDRSVERPPKQVLYKTDERLPLDDFPLPAYDQIDFASYFVLSIQFSSGCPYSCEFCDIPELYGKNPRLKSPDRVCRELDAILARRPLGGIYFVDDNLIGNKRAARGLLERLIEWQRENGYPLRFGAECTLNLAQDPELLSLMREAYFTDIFFGIESPDEDTLESIDKPQNVRMPILEAVRIINDHGIELHAGIILGLDNDGPDAAEKILRFIEQANIPLLAVNVLYALPRTPLWRRLEEEGRLIPTADVDQSNVVFKLPAEQVLAQYRRVVEEAFTPEALYRRYRHNVAHTYPRRKRLPLSGRYVSWQAARLGSFALFTIFTKLGLQGHYRRQFWTVALELLRAGRIDHLIYIASMGHHLISFRDDVRKSRLDACFYSERSIDAPELKRSTGG